MCNVNAQNMSFQTKSNSKLRGEEKGLILRISAAIRVRAKLRKYPLFQEKNSAEEGMKG